jgi:LemA protein
MFVALGTLSAVAVALGLGVLVSWNRFARQRQLLRSSWSQLDSELQRRYDLLPNLVEVVRGYASHERTTLEAVAAARGAAVALESSAHAQSPAQTLLGTSVKRVVAIAERYPDLAASDQFRALQSQLVTTEDRIQAARRLFNANARDYNIRIDSFPSNIVARLFGLDAEEYFTLEPAIRRSEVPSVRLTPQA